MKKLVQNGRAPRGAIVPHYINSVNLFDLDVDDDIWQDVGLSDMSTGSIPLWLGNENVRQGIKYLLERDRCNEEQKRLSKELHMMQEWMFSKWTALKLAQKNAENQSEVLYQLELYENNLASLCLAWQDKVRIIPSNRSSQSWGPSLERLQNALDEEYTLSADVDLGITLDNVEEEVEKEEEEEKEENPYEAEYIDAYELAVFQDQFRDGDEDTIMELRSLSPIKRGQKGW